MKVVPPIGGQSHRRPAAESASGDDLYSWMIRGVHAVRIDPRRRWGRHQGLRQLLADDAPMTSPSEPLQALGAALRRQTLGQGLSRLQPKEADVIRLAYLEGMANQAIADRLGTSVSTVRRLLATALQKMEVHMRKAGGSFSALALLALGALHAVSSRLERTLWTSSQAGQGVVSLLATGTTVVAALAVVSLATPVTSDQPLRPGAAELLPAGPATGLGLSANRPGVGPTAGDSAPSAESVAASQTGDPTPASRAQPSQVTASTTPAGQVDAGNGCGHQPTNAPPPVPVGPRTGHPTGPPVTHTKPDNCHS